MWWFTFNSTPVTQQSSEPRKMTQTGTDVLPSFQRIFSTLYSFLFSPLKHPQLSRALEQELTHISTCVLSLSYTKHTFKYHKLTLKLNSKTGTILKHISTVKCSMSMNPNHNDTICTINW